MQAIERSEAAITDTDLAAEVVLGWTDSDGEFWYHPRRRNDAEIISSEPGPDYPQPAWAVGVMLPCSPSAAVFIHFGPEDGLGDSLTPGDYPIVAFGFDVSAREQGGDNEAMEFDGVVTITAAGNGRASGFMLGWARTELKSHLTQERLGATIEVGALAFHDIRAEWVSGDEE